MESAFSNDDRIQLSFLRDVEVDAIISSGHLPAECGLDSPLDSPVRFTFPELILHITPGPYYPVLLQSDGFIRVENLQLGRVPCDTLRAELLRAYDRALESNTLSAWQAREELNAFGIFEPEMLVLQLVSETANFLSRHREAERQRLRKHHDQGPPEELQLKPLGEIRSASEMAHEFVGSPAEIAKMMPDAFRVLHIEEILRTDLARRFYAARKDLAAAISRAPYQALRQFAPPTLLSRRPEDLREHLLKTRVTFHGSQRHNVPSIVRSGLLKPGMRIPDSKDDDGKAKVQMVQHGSTYGQGVYSSPSPEFALSYSGEWCEPTPKEDYFGLKLIVCAVLMGRTASVSRDDCLWGRGTALDGADSHVANRGYEYIVFDPAQILPVYVVHLDWGEFNRMHCSSSLVIPRDPTQWQPSRRTAVVAAKDMAPGDRQRAKEQIMARASKWFPYGYGPFTKGKFVVEDVAEVSDDEEDYGEFQSLRPSGEEEAGGSSKSTEYWAWVKAGWDEQDNPASTSVEGPTRLDEYTSARHRVPKAEWDAIPQPWDPTLEDNSFEADEDLGLGALLFGHHGVGET